jgi:biotin operon repressor
MAYSLKPQAVKVLEALQSGKTITPAQAASRYGVSRMSARVQELRQVGVPVLTVTSRGKTAYRLGTPSQAMIAAAYQAAGASVFN